MKENKLVLKYYQFSEIIEKLKSKDLGFTLSFGNKKQYVKYEWSLSDIKKRDIVEITYLKDNGRMVIKTVMKPDKFILLVKRDGSLLVIAKKDLSNLLLEDFN